MHVYIVEYGYSYSSDRIAGVFTSKSVADFVVAGLKSSSDNWDFVVVTERELDVVEEYAACQISGKPINA